MDILKNKNKILAVVMVVFVVIAIAGIILFNLNTVKQTNDTCTHEAGQELILDASKFFDADEKKAAQITFDTSAVDVNTVGEYTAIADFKGKHYEITVAVVDTTAPMVEFTNRYVFTNDIANADCASMFAGVYDSSEYTAKLIRFEHSGNLQVMDETALNSLTDMIPVPCDAEELKTIGTEEIPTEPGIYRAVLEITDVHGNSTLEEVYVIYDTTGALIEDVPDKVVHVSEDDLDKEPAVDKNDYTITDNVDGAIETENINCELELRDAEKHEWLVHVSYTDRAGNESKAEFLITVKEESAGNDGASGQDNKDDSSDNGAADNSGSNDTDDSPLVDESVISPSMQACIDAGYGVVVQLDSGNYAVLTSGDGYVNGVYGSDILRNYLANLGLEAKNGIGGSWIDPDNDWYWFIARNVGAIDTSGNEW